MMTHSIFIETKYAGFYGKYNKNFKRCIGSGRTYLALRQDYMDNLRIVQKEIGFDYIRGHGLFHDDMGVYREVIQMGASPVLKLDKPIYNFKNVLKVLDNFLSVGIRPFVEFGFMPGQMAAGDRTVFWWKGNVTEPKDINLWNKMIEMFLKTVVDYYGIEEVKKWYFEVWNEPCADFWQPTSGKKEQEYYRLYEQTARLVKKVNKDLRIGGPATQEQGIDWIPRFTKYCHENRIPLDFVSHHIYTAGSRQFDGEFAYLTHIEPKDAVKKFERVKSLADSAPQGMLPLHITEWNTSFSCIDLVHDISLNGAYVAYLLTHADNLAESYAYWVFCDVFEEADIPRALFHGGFGLLTENGIRKPSFHAFAFANKLKEHILHKDEYSFVTQDNEGNMAILLFNPVIDPAEGESIQIEMKIPCPFDEVFVSVQKVDDNYGNAYTAWTRMGRPRWPDRNKLEIIQKAQYPGFETHRLKSSDGYLGLTAFLPVNGIQLMEIFKFTDHSDGYQGLRENTLL